MNKPSKQTISDLKSVLEEIEHMKRFTERSSGGYAGLCRIETKVKGVFDQLTEDKQLACDWPGCRVVKPTTRALAAHYATTHGPRKT